MRYAGSKAGCSGICRVINRLVPPGGVYWEPFAGACKVMQGVARCRRYGSDVDRHIVTLLKAVQAGWVPPRTVTREDRAYWMRRRDTHDDPMIAFVGYGCCFGGNFFAGFVSDKYTASSARNEAWGTLLKQKWLLLDVKFEVWDYRDGFFGKGDPHLIYCDPPYAGTERVGAKNAFDSREFWRWAGVQRRYGEVLVSEYQCPLPDADVVWQRRLGHRMTAANGNAGVTKVEKLFHLPKRVRGRVGVGVCSKRGGLF